MLRLWSVQQAVYAHMSGDATLLGMVTTITDQPNQNTAFPYVTIGEGTGVPDDLLIESGGSQTLNLHIWDKSTSMSGVKGIMDRMVQRLHNASFAVASSQMVRCAVEFAEVMREGDGEIRHGIMRLRVETFG